MIHGIRAFLVNPFFDMDMFFCIALGCGAVLWWVGRRTWGIRLVLLVLIPFFILTLTPCGSWLLMRAENQYPEQPPVSENVEGMILLGGGFDVVDGCERKQILYGPSSGRVMGALHVAHQFPSLKILLTGSPSEVALTKRLFEEHKIDPSRFILEPNSDSTLQNAQKSYDLVKPDLRPWLLVTSAYHMKRAVDMFESTGWRVIPYPVDYKTGGTFSSLKSGSVGRHAFWLSAREWLSTLWHGKLNHSWE